LAWHAVGKIALYTQILTQASADCKDFLGNADFTTNISIMISMSSQYLPSKNVFTKEPRTATSKCVHTNISMLIAEGVDVRTIASHAGHANINKYIYEVIL